MIQDPKTPVGAMALAGAVFAMALLGGIARMFHDTPSSDVPLRPRDWFRYCSAALLAGIILATIAHHYYGWSPMLFGLSGLGGFGATQLLGFAVELLKGIAKAKAKQIPPPPPPRPPDPDA